MCPSAADLVTPFSKFSKLWLLPTNASRKLTGLVMSPQLPRLCPLSSLSQGGFSQHSPSLWGLQLPVDKSPPLMCPVHLSPLQGKAQQHQSQARQHPRLEARSPPQREALVRAPAGRTQDGDRVFSSVSDRGCARFPVLSHVCWHGDAGLRAHCPLASCVPVSTLTETVHDMTKEPFAMWPQFWACVSAQGTTGTAPTPLLRRHTPNLKLTGVLHTSGFAQG